MCKGKGKQIGLTQKNSSCQLDSVGYSRKEKVDEGGKHQWSCPRHMTPSVFQAVDLSGWLFSESTDPEGEGL